MAENGHLVESINHDMNTGHMIEREGLSKGFYHIWAKKLQWESQNRRQKWGGADILKVVWFG